ncbi:hypothetical protein LUZ60_012090 [Juncus effusus]|nr:hypothetical protein LUZ60_012090 [Juncus effusus]
MTSLPEGAGESNSENSLSNPSESGSKTSIFSSIFTSPFSIFESANPNFFSNNKDAKSKNYAWTRAVKRIMTGGAMRRLQDRLLGTGRIDTLSSTSEIWLLGVCYKISLDESSSSDESGNGFSAFLEDFYSRIWITYRKGFEAMGDSKLTSDVNWGCMIRSSQMLVAQALIFHHLGRSWRKPSEKPFNEAYIKTVHKFLDAPSSPLSLHNLILTGLHAGSWLGPYAMCRAWEALARTNSAGDLPFAVLVVSGDEDGERGGAPVVVKERVGEFIGMRGVVLLVPLVLGLDKVNPRYIPLLKETFMFPQSLGILGGKPGASTYIVGIQDEKALYLDPHEVQLAVDFQPDNLEADTSSYHCSTVRHLPLDQIDSSLAIGFYCRDKDDFDDFCSRASELDEKANGAPLFTVTDSLSPSTSNRINNRINEEFNLENYAECSAHTGEDEWQIL